MKRTIQHVHFIGIGGAGMSGIAEILHSLGFTVSGSDIAPSATLDRLQGLGIASYIGHHSANIGSAQVVVTSSAVRADNPEVLQAKAWGIPVIPRAMMLAELMRQQRGIAVAGTHGKTTTTSLLASLLLRAGLEPSFVIGGRLNSAGVNAQLGKGDYIAVEADESDASFLHLLPYFAVVTNIDADHMDTYGHDFERLKAAFVEFLQRMPFYGKAFLCSDDATVESIAPQVQRPIVRYGLNEHADVRAVGVRAVGTQMHFTVQRRGERPLADLDVVLNLSGVHNVRNALAIVAIAAELQIADADLLSALAHFQGVGRRLQSYGELALPQGGSITLIDDYGHHPVEIEATLAAVRGAYPKRRLVLAFEPHRYSRTRDCLPDFARTIGTADAVLLAPIYSAGESPIEGVSASALAQAIQTVKPSNVRLNHVYLVPHIDALAQMAIAQAQGGDVLLCMGAGSIGKVPAQIAQLLQQPSRIQEPQP